VTPGGGDAGGAPGGDAGGAPGGDYAGGRPATGPLPAGPLPADGLPAPRLLAEIRHSQARDVDWRNGRSWAFTYFASDELLEVIGAAYQLGISANGLSGAAFPSLARFESDILAWVKDLLGGGAAGSVTSGGSESILLAVKAARDWARQQGRLGQRRRGNVVAARSAHPGFAKAAHYLDLDLRRCALRGDQRADPAALAALIDDGTVLVVASAPSYPHGVVDDVPAIAGTAAAAGLPCHVDACVGGMVLPFARSIGAWQGGFGFEVPGVTSVSVDLHKYGYTAKGASVILYRSAGLFGCQTFAHSSWTGGRYEVPNLCGTRPGGAITAAWAAMRYLGQAGYQELTRQSLAATATLRAGLDTIPGLHVAGDPDINLIAVADTRGRIPQIAAGLRRRGWVLGTQGDPARGEEPSIHLTVTAGHLPVIPEFLAGLAGAADEAAGTG
jgi:sphinganine-1-phosphate aldolase